MEDGSSYSMRGPSRESMNVIVFAIKLSRQCEIGYHIEGHYHFVNQSNECKLFFFFFFFVLFNNSIVIKIGEERFEL